MNYLDKKKNFGQFFTSNVDYIFQGFEKFVKNKIVSDPFAGDGDLLKWAENNKAKSIKGFDIDEKLKSNLVSISDSILTKRRYDFIITNPPYLNINKADKTVKLKYFSRFKYEDLFKYH